jgi:mitochondrial import receptor subunit TOM70
LLEVTQESVEAMDTAERLAAATKLKEAGNRAYGSKDYVKAIDLYSKAILCRQDPVYYANRAACFSALAKWDNVIEDTTAALAINPEYVKALNRRANAYEQTGMFSESLLDFTASCIIDGFKEGASTQAVERVLKRLAETKAKELMSSRPTRLPSPTFVSNYLGSFRPRPRPAGLGDADELSEETGKGQLRHGLQAMDKKTADAYEEAATAFDRALELDDLGEYESLAYNMRGTFQCLRGKHDEALEDLSKSINLDPDATQSYIKRASMYLELGKAARCPKKQVS